MGQLIKFGISNYLQLCVEAGFSQIQSHFMYLLLAIVNYFKKCISVYWGWAVLKF